jgi:beta-1,4-mannosyl-glycoprotein beta-1,4-N-acetylglucosaminyltransferase
MNELIAAIKQYAYDTENPDKNYNLGLLYQSIGQTASAITFYMRAAELTNDTELAYECIMRQALCYEFQGNRRHTVCTLLKHALCIDPKRPEAYYHMSRVLCNASEHVESYLYAQLGFENAVDNPKPLRNDGPYYGKYVFVYHKAVSSWHWGRGQESRDLFQYLADHYYDVMIDQHKESVQENMVRLGAGPQTQVFRHYDPSKYDKMRCTFPGLENVKFSHSQVYQDLFVLCALQGKKNGTYFEIGSAMPFVGNNTALLEKEFGWTGIGIDYKKEFVDQYAAERSNRILHANALEVDYNDLMSQVAVNGVIDYLQLDCEPAKTTYEIMERIPFDKFKFAVITYEHDYYADITRKCRKLSREFLESKGYKLIVNDISGDGKSSFEDWWVHPDLVSADIIQKLTSRKNIHQIEDDYFLVGRVETAVQTGKVIDCFQYFNEKELLELRIKLLYDHVDKFIITESNKSFSGIPKEFTLRKTIKELGLPEDKIEIVEVDLSDESKIITTGVDYQILYKSLSTNSSDSIDQKLKAWTRERMQKNAWTSLLPHFDDDTVFIVSDCDELIDPERIKFVANVARSNKEKIIRIPLAFLQGRADLITYHRSSDTKYVWDSGMFVCTKEQINKSSPIEIRNSVNLPAEVVFITDNGVLIDEMGWHFSWMGNSKIRDQKSKSFSHFSDEWDGLVFKKFGSADMEKFIKEYTPEEGKVSPCGHIDTIMKKYDIKKLPQLIFSLPNVRDYMFGA